MTLIKESKAIRRRAFLGSASSTVEYDDTNNEELYYLDDYGNYLAVE